MQKYKKQCPKQNLTDNKNNVMICNYCEHSPSKLHHHYNIQQVKQRFNPTYSHAHIFNPNGPAPATVRCTPTFHSTAFDVEGYRPITNQHLRRGVNQQGGNVVNYKNVSLERKQEELNPATKHFDLKLRNQWYDPAKQELFNSLQCFTERYSRERKMADLSSNPVFGGTTLEVVPRKTVVSAYHPERPTNVEQPLELINNGRQDQQQQEQKPTNLQQIAKETQTIKEKDVKQEEKINADPHIVIHPPAKQQNHQFSIKNEVTFGKKGNVGKKLNKNSTIQAQKPAFTVIKNRRN